MGYNYIRREVIDIAVKEEKKKANKKWEESHCKQIRLVLPNELAARLESHCKQTNQSKNGFIKTAIVEKLDNDEKIEH